MIYHIFCKPFEILDLIPQFLMAIIKHIFIQLRYLRVAPAEESEPISSPPSVPAIEFRSFMKLPPELQSMIWHFAFPGPRIIQVKGNVTEMDHETGLNINFTACKTSFNVDRNNGSVWRAEDARLALYSLLATCSHSRTVALNNFKDELPSGEKGLIRFDGAADTIMIRNFAQLMLDPRIQEAFENDYQKPPCFDRIQRLAVYPRCMAEDMPAGKYKMLAPEFTCFRNLSELFALSAPSDIVEEEEEAVVADYMRTCWDIRYK
jgi:hypothetical protein